MTTKELAALEIKWVKQVYDNAAQVDPSNELHWHSLKYGWALAKGIPIDQAFEFSYKGLL